MYDSNVPAHRWCCKHLEYLVRLDLLIGTLKEYAMPQEIADQAQLSDLFCSLFSHLWLVPSKVLLL